MAHNNSFILLPIPHYICLHRLFCTCTVLTSIHNILQCISLCYSVEEEHLSNTVRTKPKTMKIKQCILIFCLPTLFILNFHADIIVHPLLCCSTAIQFSQFDFWSELISLWGLLEMFYFRVSEKGVGLFQEEERCTAVYHRYSHPTYTSHVCQLSSTNLSGIYQKKLILDFRNTSVSIRVGLFPRQGLGLLLDQMMK